MGDFVETNVSDPEPPSTSVSLDKGAQSLRENMEAMSRRSGLTKRTAARLAIVEAIQSGVFRPGDKLPSELKLTGILGVSLGTVQAALRQLQLVGSIVRRRGDGSRVAAREPFDRSVWHFRFVSKSDGKPLRITNERVQIELISGTGAWSDYLGERQSFLRIRRWVSLIDGTPAGAEMFLDPDMVPGLQGMNPNELDMVNIRPYLEERYGIVTAGANHIARTVRLDKDTAGLFGLEAGSDCFEIHAKAYSNDDAPVYFQRIFISTDVCALTF